MRKYDTFQLFFLSSELSSLKMHFLEIGENLFEVFFLNKPTQN